MERQCSIDSTGVGYRPVHFDAFEIDIWSSRVQPSITYYVPGEKPVSKNGLISMEQFSQSFFIYAPSNTETMHDY